MRGHYFGDRARGYIQPSLQMTLRHVMTLSLTFRLCCTRVARKKRTTDIDSFNYDIVTLRRLPTATPGKR